MILSPSFLIFRKLGESNRKVRQRQRQELLRLGGQGRGGQAQAQPGHRQGPDREQQPFQPQCRQAAPNIDSPWGWAGGAVVTRPLGSDALAPAACPGARGFHGTHSPSGAQTDPKDQDCPALKSFVTQARLCITHPTANAG